MLAYSYRVLTHHSGEREQSSSVHVRGGMGQMPLTSWQTRKYRQQEPGMGDNLQTVALNDLLSATCPPLTGCPASLTHITSCSSYILLL